MDINVGDCGSTAYNNNNVPFFSNYLTDGRSQTDITASFIFCFLSSIVAYFSPSSLQWFSLQYLHSDKSSFVLFYCLLLAHLLPELQQMTSEVSHDSQHFQICGAYMQLGPLPGHSAIIKTFPKLPNCPWGPSFLLNLKLYYNIFW